MGSINLTQLRNTRLLKSLLRTGETIELLDRKRVIARIEPEPIGARPQLPDFAARRAKIFGKRVFPGSALVISERGRY